MALDLSRALEQQLEALAKQQGCSVESLLTSIIENESTPPPIAPSLYRLLDLSSDLVGLVNFRGQFISINPAFSKILGYDSDTFLNTHFSSIIHPDELELTQATFESIVAGTPVTHFKVRCRCHDGDYKSLEWAAMADDGVIYFIGRDITAQELLKHRAEDNTKALRESERRLQGIIDSQIDLVCRYLPDTTLTFVNDAYCRHFGKSREDLLGHSFLVLSKDAQKAIIFERIAQVTTNPAPAVRIISGVAADGQERWIQWVDSGIVDRDGNVVEIQAVGRDITSLKLTERELRQQQELLQTIFDHIPVMIALNDQHEQTQLVNQEWVDVFGSAVFDVIQSNKIIHAIEQSVSHNAPVMWQDTQIKGQDGQPLYTTWTNVPLTDGRSIKIGQDITQRKELEDQRLHAQQLEIELRKERELIELKERFISMVSHEFRTPLAVIVTSVSLITRFFDRLSEEKIMGKLHGVTEQIDHLVALLDDVLVLSKANANKLTLSRSTFDVSRFLEHLIDNARLIDTDNHQFRLNIVQPNTTITADKRLLEHIFTNLISNAQKYSPPQTTVTVTAKTNIDAWEFTVSDEGIGIPEEDLDLLFTPFHRASNVGNISGTGLGLTIIKNYVELHNGTIAVETEANKGTTFHIRLPHPQV